MSAPKPPPLVEGIDFYKEGEKMVFTSTFLLKRGFCCNSRCRHCPYGNAPSEAPLVSIIGVSLPIRPRS